ncbi:uncharacterized protein LOC129246250 [Anastrepha obliqua]|uniref:uncharacterized protein LOC129246250 n=1 Tax=Anastrepha obliqua TaxID=95512 RepID=UPI00240931DD|nr:uncharacterized protein LOC129246250 [Anastrepha obliqua]
MRSQRSVLRVQLKSIMLVKQPFVVVATVGLTVLFLSITNSHAECLLNVYSNLPVIMKSDNVNRIMYAQEEGVIKMNETDEVEVHCLHGISIQTKLNSGPQNVNTGGSKQFKCYKGYRVHYRNANDSIYKDVNVNSVYLSCQDPWTLTLYESSTKLPNCKSYMNYAMGLAVPNVKDIISAGMCYDLDTLSLKYVNYLAYRPKYDEIIELNSSALSKNQLIVNFKTKLGNLNTYFSFMSQGEFSMELENVKEKESILENYDFDYVSLLQDGPLQDEFAEFTHIFNTMWWRNLRIGNWRFFLDALAARSRVLSYRVYVGTSGQMRLPDTSNANRTAEGNTLTVEAGSLVVQPPAYIWSYLKSLKDDVNEDFVVIAFNSPYYYLKSTAIFCHDICDKIDWLKNSKFGHTRLMPTFGITFCCRPEEVARTFKQFPLD